MKYGKLTDELENMGFSLTRDLADYLRERAKGEDRSISSIVRRILEAEVKRSPLPEPLPAKELAGEDGV